MGKTLGEMWRTCNHCDITFDTPEQFSEHWSGCPVRVKHGYINERTERRLKASQLLGGPPTAEELQGEYILPSQQRKTIEQSLMGEMSRAGAMYTDRVILGLESEQKPQPTPAHEYYGISIDDIAEQVYEYLGRNQDGKDGHNAMYTGTREQAIDKCTAVLHKMVSDLMYKSNKNGYAYDESEQEDIEDEE